MDTEEILKQIKANPLLDGVTFSGGEPFCQAEALSGMIEDIRKLGLDIVVYTGYTWEQLREMSDPAVHDLLKGTDILIDGPFIEAEKDLTLTFRGSRNQRLIDVNKTLEQGFIQLTDL